jgi:hypothetical protein
VPLHASRELFEREYLLTQINLRFGGNIQPAPRAVGMERCAPEALKTLGVVTSIKAECARRWLRRMKRRDGAIRVAWLTDRIKAFCHHN